jgi:hypothetical protein
VRIESCGGERAFFRLREYRLTHGSFKWDQMKVFINLKEWEFQEGTKFIEVVNLIRGQEG